MNADDLELLSVTLMDIRATVESMRRSVTNAHADIERLRHGVKPDVVDDLRRCIDAITKEAGIVNEAVATVQPHLG